MFDDYSITTGAELNELLDAGYSIASDGAILPPGTFEQTSDAPIVPESPPLPTSSTLHVWVDVDGDRTGK
jgi:hypothetical protein